MVTGRFRSLSLISCIGMLLVLLAGALVTNTGAGMGCGRHWPLCNGKFVPALSLASLIEYSHRFITGLEGIVVVAVFIWTIIYFRKDKSKFLEPLYYAGAALLFTIIQALMGAAAVMWSQVPAVMALHFGISLLAVAATMLHVAWTRREKHGELDKPQILPRSIFPRMLLLTIYCYVVVYLGAFIRHTESTGGCLDWPLCNGKVIPDMIVSTGLSASGAVFIHRVAGLILGLCILGMFLHIRKVTRGRSTVLTRSSAWSLVLLIAQILSGAWLTLTILDDDWFIFTSLFHNLIVTGLFGLLVDILIRSWRFRERR
ncbi:COX15/CtaA family protein [Paenibacillus protaetiae]|uniref:Heme A synthase n=1 Tax=Paenibacillus protaetiae TaxID=2509456 RepID=A0A4V0YFM3_9BACL|nr:COX15/CtaA family protein [Paenibacillus protaetiae]QAY68211.1 heme A synthase [Paenibacillus protaetiae]